MKKLMLRAGAAGLVVLPGLAVAGSSDFTMSVKTLPALSVTCSGELRFGTLAVEPNNNEATVTVDATSSAVATSSSSDVYPAESESGPAACTITNSSDSDATAQLSATSTSTSGARLSDLKLVNGDSSLSAVVELAKTTGIGNETIYIGGSLTIPADHVHWGTYSETVTLTVTE